MSAKKRRPLLKWFLRTAGVLGLILVGVTSWAAWRVFGPLPPMPDYHAELTAHIESRLPVEGRDPNALNKYDLAFEAVELAREVFADERAAMSGAEPEAKLAVEYHAGYLFGLQNSSYELDRLMNEPRGGPLRAFLRETGRAGVWDIIDRIPSAPRAVRPMNAGEPMFDTSLDEIGDLLRCLGRVQVLEFRRAVRQADRDAAMRAVERVCAIASVYEYAPWAIECMAASSLMADLYGSIREEMAFDPDLAPDVAHVLSRAEPTFDAPFVLRAGGIAVKDTVSNYLRGHMDDYLYMVHPPRRHNRLRARLFVRERDAIAFAERINREVVDIASELPDVARRELDEFEYGYAGDGSESGEVIEVVNMFIPSYWRYISDVHSSMLERGATRLMLAIERYRLDHEGAPPASLDALVPEYLDEVPIDPLSDAREPFGYRLITAFDPDPLVSPKGRMLSDEFLPIPPRRYLLWSAGRDHVDDGGDAEHDYILNSPPRAPEDDPE